MKKWVRVSGVLFAVVAGVITYARFHSASTTSSVKLPAINSGQEYIMPSDEDLRKQLTKEEKNLIDSMDDPFGRHLYTAGFALRDNFSGKPEEIQLFVDTVAQFEIPKVDDGSYDSQWGLVNYSLAVLAGALVQAGPYPSLEKQCIKEARRILSAPNKVDAQLAQIQALALLDVIRRDQPNGVLPAQAENAYQNALKNGYLKHELSIQIDQVLKVDAQKVGRTLPGK